LEASSRGLPREGTWRRRRREGKSDTSDGNGVGRMSGAKDETVEVAGVSLTAGLTAGS
jgi:hypothetical protein